MKICLVKCQSKFLIDDRVYPPLGLMAVGAGLRQHNHEVIIYDGDLAGIPMDCEGYGFGPTAPEYPYALAAKRAIEHQTISSRIVLGGPHATFSYTSCLADGWDSVVVGDGEISASRAFTTSASFIKSEEQPLDNYPIPDRSLLPIHDYHFMLGGQLGTTLVTSRGCPFSCAFCCKVYKSVRLRSAESVIKEIGILQDEFRFNVLGFPEDIFILNRARTEKIAACLKERSISWRCLARADLIVRYGQEFLNTLANSGCVSISMGIESGSTKILKTVNKGETPKTFLTAIRMLKEAGIPSRGYFMVGLPGEDETTLSETERFLQKAKLGDAVFYVYQPYPGSAIYDKRDQFDIAWNGHPLSDSFFKGKPGEERSNVSTSKLSSNRITEACRSLEKKYTTSIPTR